MMKNRVILLTLSVLFFSCQSLKKKHDHYDASVEILDYIRNRNYHEIYDRFNREEYEKIHADTIKAYVDYWAHDLSINELPTKENIKEFCKVKESELFFTYIVTLEYHHALLTFDKDQTTMSIYAFELHENSHEH